MIKKLIQRITGRKPIEARGLQETVTCETNGLDNFGLDRFDREYLQKAKEVLARDSLHGYDDQRHLELSSLLIKKHTQTILGRQGVDFEEAFSYLVAGLAVSFNCYFNGTFSNMSKEDRDHALAYGLVDGATLASNAWDNSDTMRSKSYGLFYEALKTRAEDIGPDKFFSEYYESKYGEQ